MVVIPATAAWSQAAPGPKLTGSVQGSLTHSSRVVFRLTATEASGWQNLHELRVSLLLHGVTLDELVFDQENTTVGSTGGLPVLVGTPDIVSGAFFRMTGLDVALATGGNRLALTMRAVLLQDVPPGAAFRLSVVDDLGNAARIAKAVHLQADTGSGFSFGVLLAAVIGALFAGSFIGNVFASRRRPAPRPSIYSAVQRRIDEERSSREAQAGAKDSAL
jgi:hypothetical protein